MQCGTYMYMNGGSHLICFPPTPTLVPVLFCRWGNLSCVDTSPSAAIPKQIILFLKPACIFEPLEGVATDHAPLWSSGSVGLGWGPRSHVSNEFPREISRDIDATGPQTRLWEPWLYINILALISMTDWITVTYWETLCGDECIRFKLWPCLLLAVWSSVHFLCNGIIISAQCIFVRVHMA